MKTVSWKTVRRRVSASMITLMVGVAALAQGGKATNTTLRLGDKVVVIPSPDGFEEAASQFESAKNKMTVSEDPGNDMLAVHLLTNVTVQSGDDRRVVPLLGTISFMRVKQRLLYVLHLSKIRIQNRHRS